MRALALALMLLAAPVEAGWWSHDDGDASTTPRVPSLRFTPQLGVWIATYGRPSRACRTDAFFGPGVFIAELRAAAHLTPTTCASAGSDEIGIGAGGELAFRAWGPLHLTAALHLVYSFPERDFSLTRQLIVPLQLGALLTVPEWSFRPILAGKIAPLLYLSDDSRDFSYVAEGGFAARIDGVGDLSATLGYHTGETVRAFHISIGLTP